MPSTGVCPQSDVHFDYMTVREHIQLYIALKGVDERDDSALSEAIEQFGLQDISSSRASVLSGGEKRRLSVALALLGDPLLVFFDEVGFRRLIGCIVHRSHSRPLTCAAFIGNGSTVPTPALVAGPVPSSRQVHCALYSLDGGG
jgi:ABC-type uncharacterized transport system YnjBCD ATPase subunit